jgi:hypothetical protein
MLSSSEVLTRIIRDVIVPVQNGFAYLPNFLTTEAETWYLCPAGAFKRDHASDFQRGFMVTPYPQFRLNPRHVLSNKHAAGERLKFRPFSEVRPAAASQSAASYIFC